MNATRGAFSLDGRTAFASTGDMLDARTTQIVATLVSAQRVMRRRRRCAGRGVRQREANCFMNSD